MNLYSLSQEWLILLEMFEESQGEFTPEIDSYIAELSQKSTEVIFKYQDVREAAQMGVKAVKEKISDLQAKVKMLERADENLKKIQIGLLNAYQETTGQKSMTNGAYKITLTKNPLRIDVVDEKAVPSTYLKATVELEYVEFAKIKDLVEAKSVKFTPDKKSIGEIYKTAGLEMAGCEYHQDPNVKVT